MEKKTVFEFDVSGYRENGFAKIEQFIDASVVEYLQRLVDSRDSDGTIKTFGRNAYNVGLDDSTVHGIFQRPEFHDLIARMGYAGVIFSNAVLFENNDKSTGLPWHLDITSFKYIQPENPAFSVWVALDPISSDGGGMSLLPKSLFSGHQFYQLQARAAKSVVDGKYETPQEIKMLFDDKYCSHEDRELKKSFPYLRKALPGLFSDSLYFSGFARYFLDQERVDFSLRPGDAMVFDKFVFHKTNPFPADKEARRRAFSLRFVDMESRYNEPAALKTGGDDSALLANMVVQDGAKFDLDKGIVLPGRSAGRSA